VVIRRAKAVAAKQGYLKIRSSSLQSASRLRLPPAAASQHLKVVRDAELGRGRVGGQRRLYQVDLEGSSGSPPSWTPSGSRRYSRSSRPPRRRPAVRLAACGGDDRRPNRGRLDRSHHRRGLVSWIGSEAAADPTLGGRCADPPQRCEVVGRFVELAAQRGIAFAYGWRTRLGTPRKA